MSDRLIVMYKGQVRAQLEHEEVDHEFVMRLATGADAMADEEAKCPTPSLTIGGRGAEALGAFSLQCFRRVTRLSALPPLKREAEIEGAGEAASPGASGGDRPILQDA